MSAASDAYHHASEARQWADAADREEVEANAQGAAKAGGGDAARERAVRYAAISQAHSLAALATMVTGDYLDVRTTPG